MGLESRGTPRFSSLLFDLDGTLTDPGDGIADSIRHALRCLGFDAPPRDDLRWAVGPPLPDTFRRLIPAAHHARIGEAIALYRDHYRDTGTARSLPYSDVRELLEDLHRDGVRLFIATSKPAVTAESILRRFSLRWYFEAICGSNDETEDKTALVKEFVAEHKLNPRETAIIGDRESDIIAGRSNRLFTIGVAYGYGTRDELERARADVICDSVADLADFLTRSAVKDD